MIDLLCTAAAFCVVCLSILGCVALGRFWRNGPKAIRERRRANLDAWGTAHDRYATNRLLSDPNSPNYEAARYRVAKVLRAMGMEDARAGYVDMADNLLADDLMQIPTWIVLGFIGKADGRQPQLGELDMIARTEAAGRIIDVMTGGNFDWRSRLNVSDFLNSADWHTALAYADAALAAAPETTHDR